MIFKCVHVNIATSRLVYDGGDMTRTRIDNPNGKEIGHLHV